MSAIKGIDGMSAIVINQEIEQGAKFVMYQYTISILIMTFRRSSDIHFIKSGENAITKGLGWTALSFVLGWWGIPWGPIYTIGSIATNFKGGKNVTQEVLNHMNQYS
ncbi:hypothetical protein [Pedobacter aquatilis]|uniref:hypothetical protein n=1 Tax=Pedobacter aquatilis TaxID=351343 RepID=UPI00292DCB8D|nr:hypothetical protein [Pedobacter aquatilis]